MFERREESVFPSYPLIKKKPRNKKMKGNLTGTVKKIMLKKNVLLALLRPFTTEKRVGRMLTAWNDLLYSLRPSQGNFAFPIGRSFIFSDKRSGANFSPSISVTTRYKLQKWWMFASNMHTHVAAVILFSIKWSSAIGCWCPLVHPELIPQGA